MTSDLMADVREFHEKFGLAYDGRPRALPNDLREFRVKFLEEEVREYRLAADAAAEAIGSTSGGLVVDHLADQLDALIDLVYVALGNAYIQGFGPMFAEAWRRVHAANMSKQRSTSAGVGGERGNRYDVVKPSGWRAPKLDDLVVDHAHVEEPSP